MEARKRMPAAGDERVCLDLRLHGVVLVRPFLRALLLGAGGTALALVGWPATPAGAALLALAAVVSVRAAWRWERTRVVVTPERLVVRHGTLRRREATVALATVGAVEVEQGLAGRLLGYGTLVAGDLELPYVPEPRRVGSLLARLAG